MRLLAGAVLLMTIMIAAGASFAADLESLVKQGYTVVEETRVVGNFTGCDARTYLRLTNGKVFICSTYSYSISTYMPAAVILRNKAGDIKLLINDFDYSGTFSEEK